MRSPQAVQGIDEASPILSVRELTMRFGGIVALDGVSFDVEAGQIVGLIGPNGAGKTTILRAVCEMVKTTGAIRFAEQQIDRMATEDRVRLGIAHMPEGRGTFVQLTVGENLRVGA